MADTPTVPPPLIANLTYKSNKESLTDSFAATLLATDPPSPFCDAFLVSSDGNSIPVCKAALGHRSPFFYSMFFSSFDEATTSTCQLAIVDATILNLLSYAYSDEAPPVSSVLSRLSALRSPTADDSTAAVFAVLAADLDKLVSLAEAADFVQMPRLARLCSEAITALFDHLPAMGCAILEKCHEFSGGALRSIDLPRFRREVLKNLKLYFGVPHYALRANQQNNFRDTDSHVAVKDSQPVLLPDTVIEIDPILVTTGDSSSRSESYMCGVLQMSTASLRALFEYGVPKDRVSAETLIVGLHAWVTEGVREDRSRSEVAKEITDRIDLTVCSPSFLLGAGETSGLLRAEKLYPAMRFHRDEALKLLYERDHIISHTQAQLKKLKQQIASSVVRDGKGNKAVKKTERNLDTLSSTLTDLGEWSTATVEMICEENTRQLKPEIQSRRTTINPEWMHGRLLGIQKGVLSARGRLNVMKMELKGTK